MTAQTRNLYQIYGKIKMDFSPDYLVLEKLLWV